MLVKHLDDDQPINIVQVYEHRPDYFFSPEDRLYIREEEMVETNIITDGKVSGYDYNGREKISRYSIDGESIMDVDTLEKSSMSFRNHSYVIRYTTGKLFKTRFRILRLYALKDITIFLKNCGDKKSLMEARKIIKTMEKYNKFFNSATIESFYETDDNKITDDIELTGDLKNDLDKVYCIKWIKERI